MRMLVLIAFSGNDHNDWYLAAEGTTSEELNDLIPDGDPLVYRIVAYRRYAWWLKQPKRTISNLYNPMN